MTYFDRPNADQGYSVALIFGPLSLMYCYPKSVAFEMAVSLLLILLFDLILTQKINGLCSANRRSWVYHLCVWSMVHTFVVFIQLYTARRDPPSILDLVWPWIMDLCFRSILYLAPHNFTFGEGFLLSQLIVCGMYHVIVNDGAKGLDTDTSFRHRLQETLIFGILLVGTLLSPLLMHIRRIHAKPELLCQWKWFSMVFYVMFGSIVWFVFRPWVMQGSNPDPFTWTWNFATQNTTHLVMIVWWLSVLLLMVVILNLWSSGTKRRRRKLQDGFQLDFRRKFFHFVTVALFLPSILLTVRPVWFHFFYYIRYM
jgi:hypothetical protein